ncbi:MAG: hypothetical protein R2816_00445 [Flavobacteriaceae bacterium]
MLKNILNLKGAQQLSKKEQLSINGGDNSCWTELECESQCNYGGWCGRNLVTDCYDCVPSGGGNQ